MLLAAYARWAVECLHDPRQKACKGGVYRRDQTKLKQSIGYLLPKSIIGFKFKYRLIEAGLTSLILSIL